MRSVETPRCSTGSFTLVCLHWQVGCIWSSCVHQHQENLRWHISTFPMFAVSRQTQRKSSWEIQWHSANAETFSFSESWLCFSYSYRTVSELVCSISHSRASSVGFPGCQEPIKSDQVQPNTNLILHQCDLGQGFPWDQMLSESRAAASHSPSVFLYHCLSHLLLSHFPSACRCGEFYRSFSHTFLPLRSPTNSALCVLTLYSLSLASDTFLLLTIDWSDRL